MSKSDLSLFKKIFLLFSNKCSIFIVQNKLNNVMFYPELANAAAEHHPYCPACESKNSVKNGTRKGVQNFRCKDCGKYFNEKTGSVFQYLKKPKQFFQFAKEVENHSTIRNDAVKFKVTTNTIMNWRKKTFVAFSQCNQFIIPETEWMAIVHEPIKVKGSYLPEAVKKRTAKNIEKNTTSVVICGQEGNGLALQSQKKINGEKSALQLAKKQMKQFRKRKEAVPPMKKKAKPSGIQAKQAGDYLLRFTEWAKRFRGLSTKYKQCYFNWFRHIIEGAKEGATVVSKMLKLLLQEKTYLSYLKLIAPPQVRIQWVDAEAKTA